VHLKNCVAPSSPARVCTDQVYARLLSHFGHATFVVGLVLIAASSLSITTIGSSVVWRTIFLVGVGESAVFLHLHTGHTYTEPSAVRCKVIFFSHVGQNSIVASSLID